MKNITYSCLLFLFIFNFPIISIVSSGYISATIAIIIVLCNPKKWLYLKKLIENHLFYLALLIYLLFISFGLFSTIINQSYDMTIYKTLINNILSLFFCIFFAIIFFKNSSIEKYFSIILILQSIIIILMMLSPDIKVIIQSNIRTAEEIDRMATYGGVRGLGLSGSIAFGLAATMGLLGYILFYWGINNSKLNTSLFLLIFLICFIASLSAGRTSFLGFFLGFIFAYMPRLKLSTLLKNTLIIIVLLYLIFILLINISEFRTTIENYSLYAFQPIYKFLETGSFSVSSTEKLQGMYFLPNDTWTILFGDGKYTNIDNTYYMHTDAGYMRFMLYFGLFGSFIPYIGFILISLFFARNRKKTMPDNKYFFLGIALLAFIYHYKGEIIFFNISFMKIFFILGFYYILKNKITLTKELKEEKNVNRNCNINLK
ncbi:TPA: hypothetical protein SMN08_002177 [Proteus mirabilis]|nr:hypothetical protein [Proteus mirabilis]